MADDYEIGGALVPVQDRAQLREVDWRTADGKRRCIDCGGWQLKKGQAAVFVPILVAENEFGWLCELCFLTRLDRRAKLVNMTSSPCSRVNRAERIIEDSLRLTAEKHGR